MSRKDFCILRITELWSDSFKDLKLYMKKLLDSDWLRAVQFKCNLLTQVQIHVLILICWKTIGNFLSQWYQVKQWQLICTEILKNVFSNAKNGFKKDLPAQLPPREFFHVYIINRLTVKLDLSEPWGEWGERSSLLVRNNLVAGWGIIIEPPSHIFQYALPVWPQTLYDN